MEASYDGRQIVGMDFAPAAAGAGADDRRWHGRWGWRGILAYLIGFAAMTPFFSVGTLYEGAAARALDGADISFFVGLPVAGLLYYAFTRSVDVAAETRVAEAEAAELERAVAQHRTS